MKGAVSQKLTKIYQRVHNARKESLQLKAELRAKRLAQFQKKRMFLLKKKADPVEAGYFGSFFKMVNAQAFEHQKATREAKKASRRNSSRKSSRLNKPAVLLRQVNGVVYEYHLSTVMPIPAIDEARVKVGLKPIGIRTKYVRAIHPLTKDGFKFVCNARRARFSIKKVRRGAPQKQYITKQGDNIVFNLDTGKQQLTKFVIPLSDNKFNALRNVVEESDHMGKFNSQLSNKTLAAIREERRQRAAKRAERKFLRSVIGYRNFLLAQEKLKKKVIVERDQVLLMKLQTVISYLKENRGRRVFICDATILGLDQPLSSPMPQIVHQMGAKLKKIKEFFKDNDSSGSGSTSGSFIGNMMENVIGSVADSGTRIVKAKIDSLYDKVRSYIPEGVSAKDARNIFLFFINMVQDYSESVYRFLANVGVNIVGILNSLGLIEGKVFGLSAAITAYFRYAVTKIIQYNKSKGQDININFHTNSSTVLSAEEIVFDKHLSKTIVNPVIDHQMSPPDASMSAPIATLITAVTALIGYKLSPKDKVPNFFDLGSLRSFSMTANSMYVFISNHLEQMVKLFEWCHARMHKYMFDRVISEQPDLLREFLREASTFAFDPTMYEQILKNPILQTKVFRLSIQAHKLSAAISFNKNSSVLQLQVRQTIAQISKLQERLINDCIMPNVGYEPWVLFLFGQPGVGKSTIVYKLVPDLLESINYTSINEMIYTRSIGSDYWNGCCGQPFLWMDDAFIEEESARKQLYEWMQLKSSASFVPNCAHLEDKKRRYNPIGLIINGNKDYYDGSNLPFCYTPDAVNRRRDMLWKIDLCDSDVWYEPTIEKRQEILAKMSKYREENGKSTFEYYRFFKAKNPRIKSPNDNYDHPVLFDSFLSDIKENFKQYRMRELVAYEERVKFLTRPSDKDGLLTSEEADELISERMNEYCNSIMTGDVKTSLQIIKEAVDSGSGTVYGKKLLSSPNEQALISDEVKALEEIHKEKTAKKTILTTTVSDTTPSTSNVQHEMDESKDNKIDDTISVTQDNTAVVIDQQELDVVQESVGNYSEVNTVTIEPEETFSHMAGHMYLHRTVEWDKTQTPGTFLIEDDLPSSLFKVGEFSNSLNSSVFRGYKYYRFDVEVKVTLNASKIEYGSLLASWKYSENKDVLKSLGYRVNSQLLQGPHAFLNASSSSSITFDIPYKYVWPMIVMKPKFNIDSFCTLYVSVFNSLRDVSGTGSTLVNVSVFFRFKNISKSGLYYNLGLEHQMFSRIAFDVVRGGVERMLRSAFPDRNRDNPTDPRTCEALVPYGSHSWAHGTNAREVLNILRLDPVATTPHFEIEDQMSVKYISRIFGYIDTVKWKASDKVGTCIVTYSVSPFEIMNDTSFISEHLDVDNRNLAVYSNTPLSVLSSIYAYWRGDLEFRFDFINPFIMTGRVFVCFIPATKLSEKQLAYYTFEKCKSFYSTFYELGEVLSFTFTVPYVSRCSMMHTDSTFNDCRLGYIKLFIVNRLTNNSPGIEVDINVFMRGGSNFELAVPTLPKLFPAFNKKYYVGGMAFALNSGNDVFFGWLTKNSAPLFVIRSSFYPFTLLLDANNAAKVTPSAGYAHNRFYVASRSVVGLDISGNKYDFQYLLCLRNETGNHLFPLNFSLADLSYDSELEAMTKIKKYLDNNPTKLIAQLFSSEEFLGLISHNNNFFIYAVPEFSTSPISCGKFSILLVSHDLSTIEHQIDDRVEPGVLASPGDTSSNVMGRCFNENFSDLKDLLRRYQFYGNYDFEIKTTDITGRVLVRIPLLPSGLYVKLDTKVDDRQVAIYNQQRGGLASLLASGFRFFRGGLRVKLVFSCDIPDAVPIVSFVHDRKHGTSISTPTGGGYHNYNLSGYPMYGQSPNVNPVIELEIPYYKRTVQLWASKLDNESAHRSALGYLDISVLSRRQTSAKKCSVQVFTAFADDSRFTSFQGFPLVCKIDNIPVNASLSSTKVRKDSMSDIEFIEHEMSDEIEESDNEEDYKDLVHCEHSKFSRIKHENLIYQKMGAKHGIEDGEYLVHLNVFLTKENKCKPYKVSKCEDQCFFKTPEGIEWIKEWIKTHSYHGDVDLNFMPVFFCEYAYSVYPERVFIERETDDDANLVSEEQINGSSSIIKTIREKCKSFFSWKLLRTIAKWLGIVALVAGAIFTGVRCFSGGSGGDDNTPDLVHETFKGDRKNLRVRQQKNARFSRSVFGTGEVSNVSVLQHQIAGGYRDVTNVVKNNIYTCTLSVDGRSEGRVKITFIKERTFIGIRHFFEKGLSYKDKKVEVILQRPNIKLVLKLSDLKVTYAENSSLVVVDCPKNVPQHRDISRHIIAERDLDYVSSSCVVLDYQLEDTTIYPVQVEVKEGITVPAFESFSEVSISEVFSYNFGYKGACGSLLITTEGIPKIVGIHVAGTKEENASLKCGYSEPITIESLQFVLKNLQHEMILEEVDGLDETCSNPKAFIEPPFNVEILGTCDKSLIVHSPVVSMKVKTKAYDQIKKSVVMPAPLTKMSNGLDPMKLALDKYSLIPYSFDPKLLERCSRDVSELLITYSKPVVVSRRQWLTDKEIFEGIPQYKCYSGINLQTSEGYPLCLYKNVGSDVKMFNHHQRSGKHWLFDYTMEGSLRNYKGMHPKLLELLNSNENLRSKGVIPVTIFITTLKDQTISIEKAKAGRNRIFSCAPVQNTWAVKKYFGHWQAAYINSRFYNESAVGINPESYEWTNLAKLLLEKGNNIVTGDYKAFGDTLARDCMEEAYNIIESWYKFYFGDQQDYEICKSQRRILFTEMCYGIHMAKNVLFRKLAGIPSGFALTVEINDLVNKLYLRMAFVKITGKPVTDFRRKTYLCTYGDDLILSVSDEIKDLFNFESIQKFFEDHNIIFTPASKDDKIYKYQSLLVSTFLKGNFVPHPTRTGVFMHKLPIESVLECVNWKNRSISDDRYLYQAFRSALEGLHAYGKDTFDLYREKIFKFILVNINVIFPHNAKPDLPTWEDVDEYLYGDTNVLNCFSIDKIISASFSDSVSDSVSNI